MSLSCWHFIYFITPHFSIRVMWSLAHQTLNVLQAVEGYEAATYAVECSTYPYGSNWLSKAISLDLQPDWPLYQSSAAYDTYLIILLQASGGLQECPASLWCIAARDLPRGTVASASEHISALGICFKFKELGVKDSNWICLLPFVEITMQLWTIWT